jgi:hypothetical protein
MYQIIPRRGLSAARRKAETKAGRGPIGRFRLALSPAGTLGRGWQAGTGGREAQGEAPLFRFMELALNYPWIGEKIHKFY